MSIKKWEEIAQQKRVVEKQRQVILNAFKERKVKDEIGSLAAEKLFRPITKRLIEKTPEGRRLERQLPDYAVDDETLNWNALLFNEDAAKELPEAAIPDYGFPEEDILQENTLPDSEDETLPGEKQDPLAASATPPPYSLPPPQLKEKHLKKSSR